MINQVRNVWFSICFISFACGTPQKIIPAGKSVTFSIDTLVAPYVADPLTWALSIALYKKGVTQFFNYGKISEANPKTPTENSVYEIGSITKTFTAAMLAQMAEEGIVSIDDLVENFLPAGLVDWPEQNPISLLDLATHRSGLPRIPNNMNASFMKNPQNPYQNYLIKDLHEFLANYTPEPISKKKVSYSNLGMGLLGQLLVAADQAENYEALVDKRIFIPLDMQHSFISVKEGLLVTGHNDKGKATSAWDFPALSGAGAIRSSTVDMIRFYQAQIKEKFSFAGAHQSYDNLDTERQIGLAWIIQHDEVGGVDLIWHMGVPEDFDHIWALSRRVKSV